MPSKTRFNKYARIVRARSSHALWIASVFYLQLPNFCISFFPISHLKEDIRLDIFVFKVWSVRFLLLSVSLLGRLTLSACLFFVRVNEKSRIMGCHWDTKENLSKGTLVLQTTVSKMLLALKRFLFTFCCVHRSEVIGEYLQSETLFDWGFLCLSKIKIVLDLNIL